VRAGANLSLLRQDLERATVGLDPPWWAELALAQANGYSLWQQARAG